MVPSSTHLKITSPKSIKFTPVKTYRALKLRKIRANTCSISINNCSSNPTTNNNNKYSSHSNLKSKIPWTSSKQRWSWTRSTTTDSSTIIVISFNNSSRDNSKTSRITLSNNRFRDREAKVVKEVSRMLTFIRSLEWLLMMSSVTRRVCMSESFLIVINESKRWLKILIIMTMLPLVKFASRGR